MPEQPGTRRIRIGIDTGGTFTDVVAFDEDSGELVTTKTPSTPSNPADGFMAGIDKVLGLLGLPEGDGDAISAVSHGTTVATNQLLEGKVDALGYITTEGYEAMLEIARQSVPDGYGNSYFWVKPDRIVPRHLVKGVGGRLDFTGAEVRPFDEDGARTVARWFRDRGINTLGVCFLHAYANPEHEERMRAVLAEEHPAAVVSLSSEVLREYREYERAMTTLVDAAVKPRLSAYVNNIKGRLEAFVTTDVSGGARGGGAPPVLVPFYVMKSNGGVLSADEVVHQPITTVLSGPAAGALGAALIAQVAGFDRVLTSDGGGTSTDVSVVIDGEPTLTTEGSVGVYPSKIPMIDVVTVGAGGGSIAWLSPEGTLKVGPQSAGADPGPLCYAKGGQDVTITDAHVVLGRIPPHLLGGEIPLDVDAARAGVESLAGKLALSPEACATGILEISAWNQANALRQVTVKRGLDVRDFTLTTFGGSGSLLLCRLMDILGVPTVLVPPNPGNVSAFGLLTVDVKNDYVQTHVSLAERLDAGVVTAAYDALTRQAARALSKEGFAPEQHAFQRTADLRYFGQAFEVRVPVPEGALDSAVLASVADAFHAEHRSLYGYDFAGEDSQQVEWVNLRVSGIGPITRPEIRKISTSSIGGGADRDHPPVEPVENRTIPTSSIGGGADRDHPPVEPVENRTIPTSSIGGGADRDHPPVEPVENRTIPTSSIGGGADRDHPPVEPVENRTISTSSIGGGADRDHPPVEPVENRTIPTSSIGGGADRDHPPVEPVETPRRPVCFDAEAGYVDTRIVHRADLAPGTTVNGPVIVEEFGSTVPIHPGFRVRVDQYLNLIVTRVEEDEA